MYELITQLRTPAMLSHDGGSRFIQKGARSLHRRMPTRPGSEDLIQRNAFNSSANSVRGFIQGIITSEDQLYAPMDDLTAPSVISSRGAESASRQGFERKIDHKILDNAKSNRLLKSVDSSMASSLTSLNRGEESTLAGVRILAQRGLQSRETDLITGVRSNWYFGNIDEQTLPETGVESSGEVDSSRTIVYHSFCCNSEEKLASKNTSNSIRNSSRTCSHCGTSKTPLWRSGPMGPKSLCNACGIRLKKAGRRNAKFELQQVTSIHASALKNPAKVVKYAAADRSAWRGVKKTRLSLSKTEANEDEKGSESIDHSKEASQPSIIRQDARCDGATREWPPSKSSFARFPERRKLRREFGMSHVAVRDEEEGAALLMALSYGCLASQ